MTAIMPKAVANWLLYNTTLTRCQISQFTGLTEEYISAIDNGIVDENLRSVSPITTGQITLEEITLCEEDSERVLSDPLEGFKDVYFPKDGREKKYIPKVKRNQKNNVAFWFQKNRPDITDNQLMNFIGITKVMLKRIHNKEIEDIIAKNPVEVNFCSEEEFERFTLHPEKWENLNKKKKENKVDILYNRSEIILKETEVQNHIFTLLSLKNNKKNNI
jgi:hypothetical protein